MNPNKCYNCKEGNFLFSLFWLLTIIGLATIMYFLGHQHGQSNKEIIEVITWVI